MIIFLFPLGLWLILFLVCAIYEKYDWATFFIETSMIWVVLGFLTSIR
jgi:hypothetical protein